MSGVWAGIIDEVQDDRTQETVNAKGTPYPARSIPPVACVLPAPNHGGTWQQRPAPWSAALAVTAAHIEQTKLQQRARRDYDPGAGATAQAPPAPPVPSLPARAP
jgi:hypothetical protein